MEDENKPKLPVIQKTFTLQDMRELGAKDLYTSFGRMPLSQLSNEPEVGFGRATRKNREKVYQTKENMKAFLGRLVL